MKSLETQKISIGIGTEVIIALALETHSHTQYYLGKKYGTVTVLSGKKYGTVYLCYT